MAHEAFQDFPAQPRNFLCGEGTKLFDEAADRQRDVFFSLPQGRDVDRNDIDSVK
jgi:hypothetical protein